MLYSDKSYLSFYIVVISFFIPILAGASGPTRVYDGQYLLSSDFNTFSNSPPTITLVNFKSGQSVLSLSSAPVEFDQAQAEADCAEIRADLGDHIYCEPNVIWEIEAISDDPMYDSLYGLEKLNLPDAWDIEKGNHNIVVGVLDTGVDYTHPDLKDNMWVNEGEIAGDGIDNDGNGVIDDVYGIDAYNKDGDPMDDHGHGTHCSGTIGATGNNGVGVVGVNWSVRIMALKFLGASGGGSTHDAVTAMDYAVSMGVDIFNASFGGRFKSAFLGDAITRAENKGVIFVAAAGNSGSNNDVSPHYPSNFTNSNLISVAATDKNDKVPYFSNYGANTVHVAAPGVSILSTVSGGGYLKLSGTSMAAPHVAGLAALILAAHPSYSPTQIKNLIINTSDPLSGLSGVVQAAGRVNAAKALGSNGTPNNGGGDDNNSSPTPGESGSGDLSINLKAKNNGKLRAQLRGGDGSVANATIILSNKAGSVSCELGSTTTAGDLTTVFTARAPRGIKRAQVTADLENGSSVSSRSVRISRSKQRTRRSRARSRRLLQSALPKGQCSSEATAVNLTVSGNSSFCYR